MDELNRLEELLVFILDRAQKEKIRNLSRFQMLKIPYLIQIYSLKFAGTPFLSDITFIREKNGPISVDIYQALERLSESEFISVTEEPNETYGHPRHSHSLLKAPDHFSFSQGETIFLDNFVAKLLPLTQKELKKIAYETEPMKVIQAEEEEADGIKKGAVIDFNSVSVDPDVMETYSDEDVEDE
jgi:uncharacterized phage-associated protein